MGKMYRIYISSLFGYVNITGFVNFSAWDRQKYREKSQGKKQDQKWDKGNEEIKVQKCMNNQ